MRIVRAASIAMFAYVRWPPGFPLGGAYRDFACLYWLRFGYFMGGDSGSGAYHHHHVAKLGAMHQRLSMPPSCLSFCVEERIGVSHGGAFGRGQYAARLHVHSTADWLGT